MGTEIAQVNVFGVKSTGRFRFAFDLIAEIASPNMDGVETQVDIGFWLEGIFTGKGIQHELQVEWTLGRFPAEVERKSKKAGGGEDQLPLQQRQHLDASRDMVRFKQGALLLVLYIEVFYYQPVEPFEVDMAYSDGYTQIVRQLMGSDFREAGLYLRNPQ